MSVKIVCLTAKDKIIHCAEKWNYLAFFVFFFRPKLIQPWIRCQWWQICLHRRLSLYIKSNRLIWVFIHLLCNYKLFKADLCRLCSSYYFQKHVWKYVLSDLSVCFTRRNENNIEKSLLDSKYGKCLTSLFIFWKKVLSNIWIKWESGYGYHNEDK